jgi:hypothetical protein
MKRFLLRLVYNLGTATSCLMMTFNTGCVSGGWELTRDYSTWVNSKKVGLRVVLYILTFVVFFVTILIDVVVNNTVDFWQGRVSESTHEFHKDNKIFYVQHEIMPETQLKRSTIQVKDENHKLLQTVVLLETPKKEIELIVDGTLRTKVENIDEAFPLFTSFDKNGKLLEQKNIFIEDRLIAEVRHK